MTKMMMAFQGLLTVLVSLSTLVMMGCGGEAPQQTTDAEPTYEIQLVKLEQYTKIAQKVNNGGQYLIATLAITNKGQTDLKFMPQEFVIRPTPEEDAKPAAEGQPAPYEQNFEPEVSIYYKQKFGIESESRLFEKETVVHPGFTVKKDIIYNIPETANLSEWEIRYKTKDQVFPLGDPEVEVIDHREGSSPEEAAHEHAPSPVVPPQQ